MSKEQVWFHLCMSRIVLICSQKQLNDIEHEHTIICRQFYICRSHGGLSANEKEETFASNDNNNYDCGIGLLSTQKTMNT